MFLLNHTSYDRGDEDIQFREGASSFSYTGDAKKNSALSKRRFDMKSGLFGPYSRDPNNSICLLKNY